MTLSASANQDHSRGRFAPCAPTQDDLARTRSQPAPRSHRRGTTFPVLALALAFVSSLLASTTLAQTEHRPDGANWTITVPKGWVIAPPAALKAVNDAAQSMVARAGGTPPEYVLQLLPETPNGRYVLVQQQALIPTAVSFAELERRMRIQLEAQPQAIAEKLGMTAKPPTVDADPVRHRIIVSGTMQAGGNSLSYLSVSAFARDAQLIVHAYAPAADFDAALPELRAIADSFRLDPGAEYVFAAEGAAPTGTSPSPGASSSNRVLNGAIIGAIAGAIIGLVSWLIKRRAAA